MIKFNTKTFTFLIYAIIGVTLLVSFYLVRKDFKNISKLNQVEDDWRSFQTQLENTIESITYFNTVEKGILSEQQQKYLPQYPTAKTNYLKSIDLLEKKATTLNNSSIPVTALKQNLIKRLSFADSIFSLIKNNKPQEGLKQFQKGLSNETILDIRIIISQIYKIINTEFDSINIQERNKAIDYRNNLIIAAVISILSLLFFLLQINKESKKLKTLANKNQTLAFAINSVFEAIVIVNLNRMVIDWNQTAETFFGKKREEVLNTKFEKAIGSLRNKEQVEALFQKVIEDGFVKSEGLLQIKGETKEVFFSLSLIKNEEGINTGFICLLSDISHIKNQIEINNQLKTVSENSFDPIIAIDTSFNIINWNKAAEKAYGYKKEDVLMKPVDTFVFSPSYQTIRPEMRKELEQNGFWQGKMEVYDINKNLRTDLVTISAIKDNNNVTCGYFGIHRDITKETLLNNQLKLFNETLEQKVAEKTKELSEKNAWLNAIYKSNPIYLAEIDINGIIISLNRSRLTQPNAADLFIGKRVSVITNIEQEEIIKTIKPVFTEQKNAILEIDFEAADHQRFCATCYISPVILNNEVSSALMAFFDKTEQKEKEEETNQLKEIIDSSIAFISYSDKNKNILYQNKSLKELMAPEYENAVQLNLKASSFHTTKGKEILNQIEKQLETNDYWVGENEIIGKYGEPIPILQSIKVHRNKNGEIAKYSTTAINITELKKNEREISKLLQLINQSKAYFAITDMDGNLQFINFAFKEALEIEGAELSDQINLNTFEIENAESRRTNHYLDIILSKGYWNGEVTFESKNGKLIPVLKAQILHRDHSGKPSYISTTAIDISELKQKETKLLLMNEKLVDVYKRMQMIREEERAEIAREIHDQLGQYLTILKIEASWLRDHIKSNDSKIKERFKTLIEAAQNTIDTNRKLLTTLHPSMLDDLGLIPTLLWHAKAISKSSDIEINISADPNNELNFYEKVNLCIFRIFQESLTNVLRYAKATTVITKIAYDEKTELVHLEIQDNGIGFKPEEIDTHKHRGILGMRERVYALGGSLKIKSILQQGTTIIADIPNAFQRKEKMS